ncbi:hypothetical protein ASA1KI_41910 [Opitutales bacterium ASA1]|uniref:SAM-dependent methyltransferase n=1 Tax=Congregicoccus parvus TaxID=3081749 RepID=UPI002B29F740|nr:hypothetical protein ASA1KI_41910 [Opitutales bacterium ASA1]
MLATCQDGYEEAAARELAAAGWARAAGGRGWMSLARAVGVASSSERGTPDWCFAHAVLQQPIEVEGGSVNALAAGVAEGFLESARGERFESAWPLVVDTAVGLDGLGRRASAVESALRELLRKRMARVARLATGDLPRCGTVRGLFLYFTDFGRVSVARQAWLGGQRRMADDPLAPSRSFLKVEEAYGVLGRAPAAGETVVDLGAAPGGWSYSAARLGATVLAIDNGPLKGGALGHASIEHRREDAFRFRPDADVWYDWLFCDLVEDPHHVLRSIVEPWLRGGWCRRFVVNLKFGRADAVGLLEETRRRLAPLCRELRARHLFHDREEFTVVGEIADSREGGGA